MDSKELKQRAEEARKQAEKIRKQIQELENKKKAERFPESIKSLGRKISELKAIAKGLEKAATEYEKDSQNVKQ